MNVKSGQEREEDGDLEGGESNMACAEWGSSESPHETAEAGLLCFKWQHFQCLCFKIMVPISRLIYQLETATDFFKMGFSLLDTFPGFTLILLYSQSHRDVY